MRWINKSGSEDEQTTQEATTELGTEISQPCIVFHSILWTNFLRDVLGIEPVVVGGHRYPPSLSLTLPQRDQTFFLICVDMCALSNID
jgi:hypothetical protein